MGFKVKVGLAFIWVCTVLTACRNDEKLEIYRRLIALPTVELEQRVASLPPQEQLQLYVFGLTEFRPPDKTLARVLAKQGAFILPALIAELDRANPNVPPQSLVLVLYMMAKDYNVAEAQEYGPRALEWCYRFYEEETYCHKMAHELNQPRVDSFNL